MKDHHDKATGDLLQTPIAKARQRWAEKQRALGRKQLGIWVTDAEREAINRLLAGMREGADDEQA